MAHLIRKPLKVLNLTENEIFMNIRKIAFPVILRRGLEIVLDVNSGQNELGSKQSLLNTPRIEHIPKISWK